MQLIDVLKAHYFVGPEGEFDHEEVLAGEGTAAGALLYSTAFCPPPEEVDGLVFIKLQEAYGEGEKACQIRRHLREVSGDTREVQRSFNLVEPLRLFSVDQPEVTDEEERLLAETLAEAWRAWLHWRYPGRRFVVELVGRDETGGEIGVTFYETR